MKSPKISVCIRKRPLTKKEKKKKQVDIVEVNGNQIVVREQKSKVDLSKYVEKHTFNFDYAFSENDDNFLIYNQVIQPLVYFALEGGKASCFAYG